MSLSTLVALAEVRAKFKESLKKPKLPKAADLVAPPISSRYGLVGTAFDYLFRFLLKRANPQAVDKGWVAEQWLSRPMPESELRILSGIADRVDPLISEAKGRYSDYLRTGEITEGLIKSAIYLAQIDQIVRIHAIDPELGVAHSDDVKDLQRLVEVLDIGAFLGKDITLLNPTFGKASVSVGGADADAFIDGTLYEIKVTKNLELPPDMFNQVMGYVLLNEIDGIGQIAPKPIIESAAIYFARHAMVFKFSVEDVIAPMDMKKLAHWLVGIGHNR
jgi:hypothetical protein